MLTFERLGHSTRTFALLAALGSSAVAFACTATRTGGGGNDTGGDLGGEGDLGTDLSSGSGGDNGGGTNIGPDGQSYCSTGEVKFVPRIPTVFVLVDRSGSIFDSAQWTPLRDAVLPVIQELQAEVRFGLGAYNSINNVCSDVVDDQGTIDLNNYEALASFYNAFSTTKPPDTLDTPTALAIEEASAILQADNGPGAKAILLVTAGDDADFCDNGGAKCGSDAVIGATQAAFLSGVQTFVLGLDAALDKATLDFWAQGGAGEQPNWADGLAVNEYSGTLQGECNTRPGWKSAWTAAGRSGFQPIALYSAAGGQAEAFLSSNTTTIADEIRRRAQGLKSCIQDLSSPEFSGVKEGAAGNIFIGDSTTPIPATDWRMNSPTILELLGDSCTQWLQEEQADLFAGFKCDQLVVR